MRDINSLIFDLCDTILRRADDVDFSAIKKYISNLNKEEVKELNKYSNQDYRQHIRSVVQSKLFIYIDTYKDNETGSAPFDFDVGDNYQLYLNEFISIYKEFNNYAQLPMIFTFVFEYIKEASEHYRFFEKFYKIREDVVTKRIEWILSKISKEIAEDTAVDIAKKAAKKAAEAATTEAKLNAKIAEEQAKEAAQKASDAAYMAAQSAVTEQMNQVTKNISETSVTILGIFAGIVLAVVAGLFYSSSVLENINSANYCRLISVSAFVGFVCFSLIALMFRYVERIRYADEKKHPRFTKLTIAISCILLLIMIVFGILQYWEKDNTTDLNSHETTVDINVSTPPENEAKNTEPQDEQNIQTQQIEK